MFTSFASYEWVWVESWQFSSLLWELKTFLKNCFPSRKLMFPQCLLLANYHFWRIFPMGWILNKSWQFVSWHQPCFQGACLELCFWLLIPFLPCFFLQDVLHRDVMPLVSAHLSDSVPPHGTELGFYYLARTKSIFSTGLAVVILSLAMQGRWRGAETSVRLSATAWTDSLLLVNRWEVVSVQVHKAKIHTNCLILESFF